MTKISKTKHITKKGVVKKNPVTWENKVAEAIRKAGSGRSSSWKGKPMMNPKGEIGIVIEDDNWGQGRDLKVEFKDKHIEELSLSNIGGNSPTAQKWRWLMTWSDGHVSWEKWGY